MRGNKSGSAARIIELIDHMESDLVALKKALIQQRLPARGNKKAFPSVREFEFCGMWKGRKDMEGLSTVEWLARLRKDQWGRTL